MGLRSYFLNKKKAAFKKEIYKRLNDSKNDNLPKIVKGVNIKLNADIKAIEMSIETIVEENRKVLEEKGVDEAKRVWEKEDAYLKISFLNEILTELKSKP